MSSKLPFKSYYWCGCRGGGDGHINLEKKLLIFLVETQ